MRSPGYFGGLYRRTGQETKAKEHLTMATTMYREMGLAFWLTQAEQSGRSSVDSMAHGSLAATLQGTQP